MTVIGLVAYADLLVGEFDGTNFHLLKWGEGGRTFPAASWYLNPVLVGPPREGVEIWLEVELTADSPESLPAVFRYIIDVSSTHRDAELTAVAAWEQVPARA